MKREVRRLISPLLAVGLILAISACSHKAVTSDGSGGANGGILGPNGDNSSVMASNGNAADIQELKTVYFPYDAATLSKDARTTLKVSAEWLKSHPSVAVQVEGYCDERGSSEYNLALGEKRAGAVRDYLTKLGVDGARLTIISYGKERPIDSGHDEEAWAKNRRAVPTPLAPHLSQN